MILNAAIGPQEKLVVLIAAVVLALIIVFCPRMILKLSPDKVGKMRLSAAGPGGPVYLMLTAQEDYDVIYYLAENASNVTASRRGAGEPSGDGWISLEVFNNFDEKTRQVWFNDGGEAYGWDSRRGRTVRYKLSGKKSRFDTDYCRELLGLEQPEQGE